jgi:hypothetical protein
MALVINENYINYSQHKDMVNCPLKHAAKEFGQALHVPRLNVPTTETAAHCEAQLLIRG